MSVDDYKKLYNESLGWLEVYPETCVFCWYNVPCDGCSERVDGSPCIIASHSFYVDNKLELMRISTHFNP